MASLSQTKSPTVAASSGTGVAWTNPAYALTTGTDFASSAPYTDGGVEYPTANLVCTSFAFDIPNTARIDGIVLTVDHHSNLDVVHDNSIQLVRNGRAIGDDLASATVWPGVDSSPITYGDSGELWGWRWTPSEINSTSFGVSISAQCADSASTALVNSVSLTVYYTDTQLTSDTDISTYLGTNSYSDAQITAAVDAANTGIESYCNRKFAADTHAEWLYLNGEDSLNLKQYPLIRLRRVSNGTKNAIQVQFSNASAASAQVTVTDTTIRLMSVVPGSSKLGYAEFTLADYSTMALLKAAIDASTDLDTGWTLTVENEDKPSALRPMGTVDLYNDGTTWLEVPEWVIPQFSIDVDSGILSFTGSIYGWVYAEYDAGYDSIPYDLRQIATEYAVALLASRESQGAVSELRIADASYKFRDASGLLTQFGDRLDAYRRRSSL